jgi:RNA polymerase sigma-70 factor (ECF subfamily)
MAATNRFRVVRGGDAPSKGGGPLDDVYREHARYVGTLAFRILGTDSDVDDVVHDVFVAAVRGLEALRDPGALRGWLGAITVRLARRRLHARRFFSLFGLEPESDYGELAAPGAGPESRAAVAGLYRLLDTLPAAQRLAWVLRHVEGESLEEVARLCDCSLATAKRRIAAAQSAVDGGLG